MAWQDWHADVLAKLRRVPLDDIGGNDHYRCNAPFLMSLPDWPIFDWSLEVMRHKVGKDTEIQFQRGRSTNPDYEMQSHSMRVIDSFGTFLDLALYGPENDVYIIAQNQAYNQAVMQPLYDGITPLPAFLLPQADVGFFWFGGKTMTPLHHDLTNNLICQIHGEKFIRLVSPNQFDKIDHRTGVHSNIKWLEDPLDRGIEVQDYRLKPREALFVPVGWWHCVSTDAPSVTVVYTSFIWDNDFA